LAAAVLLPIIWLAVAAGLTPPAARAENGIRI
jgi:hypothetical protein